MVERGKVWRNIVLPVLIGGAAVLTPLTFRSKTPLEDRKPLVVQVNQLRAEEEKQDTVYLPQAVIDSAFGWKYGNVKEVDSIVINGVVQAFRKSKYNEEVRVDIGDGWIVRVCGNGIDFYRDKKCVGGCTLGNSWDEVMEKLESDRVRLIKYTDKDGHNCLVVKLDDKTLDIYYAGIPGHGLIWIMDDNSPYTIENIGFLPDEDVLGVFAEIKGDGIVGIAVRSTEKQFTEEMRIASLR